MSDMTLSGMRRRMQHLDAAITALLDASNRLERVGGAEACRRTMQAEIDRMIREARRLREQYKRVTCIFLP